MAGLFVMNVRDFRAFELARITFLGECGPSGTGFASSVEGLRVNLFDGAVRIITVDRHSTKASNILDLMRNFMLNDAEFFRGKNVESTI